MISLSGNYGSMTSDPMGCSFVQVSTDLDRYIRTYEFVADVLSGWEL